MTNYYSLLKNRTISCGSIFSYYPLALLNKNWIFTFLLVSCFTFSGYAQKDKDIKPVIYCVKDLGNGLYQASFSYENPTNKEVVIDENGSIIKTNNGKKVAKGLNKFKPGAHEKVFTKEFGPNDYVEWTINSNGNSHTVIANANSAKKCEPDDGFIFPVIGNGKSFDIIGQELTSLCEGIAGETPSPFIFQLDNNGKVLVEIIPIEGEFDNVIDLLVDGITPDCSTIPSPFSIDKEDFLLYNNDPNTTLKDDLAGLTAIDVFMATDVLCYLNDYSCVINFARPVYPAFNNSGLALTQGDAAQTSDMVRESFRMINSEGEIVPVDGAGIKVGVMSNSYDKQPATEQLSKAAVDVQINGDLPGTGNKYGYTTVVDVKKESSNDNESDEGRAMLHILHDVAPGAELAFHTATASPREFENGFNSLATDCDIIVDDITFITEPFFGTGRISKAIQTFVGNPGKFHFTSAGNFANKGYDSRFNASLNAPLTNFTFSGSETKAHVFGIKPDGSQDYLQKISVVPGTYLIALQWKEGVASQVNSEGALQDLDIYIVDDFGRLLVGNNRVNDEGDPTEVIVFRATGTGTANILITSANGATNVPFRYIAFRTMSDDFQPDGLQFDQYFGNGASTVSGHAMTPESVTVGAVDFNKAENPVAEVFSSFGGPLSDGSYNEIDLAAPDRGNTNVGSIGSDLEGDGYPNFIGTSASAPHAAGAVALLMSALPNWYPDGLDYASVASKNNLLSDEAFKVLQLFKETASLSGANDPLLGSGLINTNKAFKRIAAQTARINYLTILPNPDGSDPDPGAEPVTVSIIGEFFPDTPIVKFDGEPIVIVEIIENEDGTTEIKAEVPEFTGNPDLVVYTEPLNDGLAGGGDSDPKKLLPDGTIALNIIANDVAIEYGQEIIYGYTVEGLPVDENGESVTFESLWDDPSEVPVVQFTPQVTELTYLDVNNYAITPSFESPLTDEQKARFKIKFINGELAVSKKDLTIVPDDETYTYGQPINIKLNYVFDTEGLANASDFYQLIENKHQSDFYSSETVSAGNSYLLFNEFRALINEFRALINDYDIEAFLEGTSWLTTEKTIENEFRALINGVGVIGLDRDHFTNYLDSPEGGINNEFRPLINEFRALINTADLFYGVVYLENEFRPLINEFRPLINEFRPLINDGTPESETNNTSFTIVHVEDGPTDDQPERELSELYSSNLITGIDVYEESHYIFPGTVLNEIEANFNMSYASGRLTIEPAVLSVMTDNFNISYGETLTVENLVQHTVFEGWVYEEDIWTVFPEDEVPYEFVKDDVTYQLSELNEMEPGTYEIKIKDLTNYDVQYKANHGYLTIIPATLHVAITPDNLTITQGDIPQFSASITGYANGDEENDVFPDGIHYYYIGMDKDNFEIHDTSVPGSYIVKIEDPASDNYQIVYDPESIIFINSIDATRKIRTYSDCVSYDPDHESGLDYKVIYRYENENSDAVYVSAGPDNKLTGGLFAGELPIVFMPGSGTFEIQFDGNQLTWSLTTNGSTNNSSVSSLNNDGTGECVAKTDNSYEIYPNPLMDPYVLTIKQNVPEEGQVYVLNLYGIMVMEAMSLNGINLEMNIDMSSELIRPGMYFIKISSASGTKTYTILKE